MAESLSSRLGLNRWSAGGDSFSRVELDNSFGKIEDNAAMFTQGTKAARPAAGKTGRFHFVMGDGIAANNGVLWYDNGSVWSLIGSVVEGGVFRPTSASAVGLVVQGLASQTGHLQRWLNSAGGEVARIEIDGTFVTVDNIGAKDLYLSGNATIPGSGSFGSMAVSGLSTLTTLVATLFKSTANRADGTPMTQIASDGSVRLDGLIAPGDIMMTGKATATPGFVLCNGASYTTASQSALFAAIGYTYGGSGSNFNVPNMLDRVPVGAWSSKPRGWTGGSSISNISVANLPSHSHGMNHTHYMDHYHSMDHNHGMAHDHNMTHVHSINHGHTASSANSGGHEHSAGSAWGGQHQHVFDFTTNGYGGGVAGNGIPFGGGITHPDYGNAGAEPQGGHSHSITVYGAGEHSHSVTVNGMSGNSGGSSSTNTGTSSIGTTSLASSPTTGTASLANTGGSSTGSTGATGSGSGLDVLNPQIALNYQIKT